MKKGVPDLVLDTLSDDIGVFRLIHSGDSGAVMFRGHGLCVHPTEVLKVANWLQSVDEYNIKHNIYKIYDLV